MNAFPHDHRAARSATGPLASPAPLPTAAARAARQRLLLRLAAVAERIGRLAAAGGEAVRPEMIAAAQEIGDCLRPHLAWEEQAVHPIVDRFACEGPATFSTSMRHEHVIIHRWLQEVEGMAKRQPPIAFARRADNLLGVVLAHFELEEEILFPILDRSVVAGELEPPGDRTPVAGAARGSPPWEEP